MEKNILKKEIDRLVFNEKRKVRLCPYTGIPCDLPEEMNCEIPIYEGEGHTKILGYTLCPYYGGKW